MVEYGWWNDYENDLLSMSMINETHTIDRLVFFLTEFLEEGSVRMRDLHIARFMQHEERFGEYKEEE